MPREKMESSRARRYPRRRTDLTVHELDGEALIFDPSSGDTHRLNETALLIWRACDGERDRESITCALTGEYDVTPADARTHVECTLNRLHECALLQDAETERHGKDEPV